MAFCARSFILRQSAEAKGLRSEQLVRQGGAWVLQFDPFVDDADRALPFAVILDALPSVVIVPELRGWDEPSRSLREYVYAFAADGGLRVEMNNDALISLGAWQRASSPGDWYATLRERWKPTIARVLIVTGVVPDPRGPLHHFYAEPVTRGDHLFRTVVETIYGTKLQAGSRKAPVLERLRDDGVWTLDVVREPTPLRSELEAALQASVEQAVAEAWQVGSWSAAVCCEPMLLDRLSAVLPVVHPSPIGTPTSPSDRRQLAEAIKRAVF